MRRQAKATGPIYTVRVDFHQNDHAFWGWRRSPRWAFLLRWHLERGCRGYGIRAFTVVAMSIEDWQAHRTRLRCYSPLCPSIEPKRHTWLAAGPPTSTLRA